MNWALPESDTYFRPLLERSPRGFEVDHLDVAIKHCRRFRTAVDGGAHVGTWSVELAKHFDRVAAFEPAADTFMCLNANVANRFNVFPMRQALGARRGRGSMADDVTREGNTGARYLVEGNDVDVMPLDQCGFEDLDFLKLDVEGSELDALRGAEVTIRRCSPVIMVEVKRLRVGHDPERAVRWLRDIGYREAARARNDRVFVP